MQSEEYELVEHNQVNIQIINRYLEEIHHSHLFTSLRHVKSILRKGHQSYIQ